MLCDFAKAFPRFVGKFLDRERGLSRRLREETVTDMWVASLVAMRGLGLHVDLANETQTGADLEIWFLSSTRDRGVGFVIQAKRSHCGKVLMRPACDLDWEKHRFEELDHAAGKKRRRGTQARDLTHAAKRSGRHVYPLYAFYTPDHIRKGSGRIDGIMLADGHDVRRRIVFGRLAAWKRRTHPPRMRKPKWGNARYKALGKLEDLLFPLSTLFCFRSWEPIKRVADKDDFQQAFMLLMRGEDVGVVRVPEPEEVVKAMTEAIRRQRERALDADAADERLPEITYFIPPDILQLASGGADGGDIIRPDVPVSRRRVACVATSIIQESASESPAPEPEPKPRQFRE